MSSSSSSPPEELPDIEGTFDSPPSPDSSSPPPPSPASSPPPPSPSPSPPSNSSPPSPPPPSPPSNSSPPSPSPPTNSSPPSPSPPSSNNSTSPSPSPPPPPQNSPPAPSNNDNNNSSGDKNNGDNNNFTYPPPPKSSKLKSPPPPRGSLPSSKDDSSDPNQSSIIVGAAAAAGLLIFLMIALLVSCSKRKKRKPHNHMNYYRDHSRNDYYASNGNWSTNDHPMKMPPPMMGSGQVSSEQNWPIGPPPPPPPMLTSSELGSANYSGPHQGGPRPPPHPAMALGFNQSSFTYTDLAAATNGFAKENLIGQGGFGYVHKGVLPNGRKVAIKSLKANSGQGEREFQAEVDIISRVHHRHLVSLVGYCIAGAQRMLVYEFVPNGNLEYHLHGPDRPTMDWPTRLKIAIGSAKGFAYLHEDCHPRIIHRDIKTANILLENNFEAKVADFGLAKLSEENHTHVSTRIMGTFGYLAPEYASSGKLTEKSDVYSYGIMLLELITGRRPIDISSDDDGLVDWARPILTQVQQGGSYEELVDPKLGNNYDPHEMLRMVACAAACIRHSARRRPKMSQILRALEGDASLEDLNEGVKSQNSTLFGSGSSSEYGSYADLSKMRKAAGISSQEFSSGEQATGEFVNEGTPGYMRGNRGYN